MRHLIFLSSLLLGILFPFLSFSQKEVAPQGLQFQAGVSALPVYDFLNQLPKNNIRGVALMGNFGCYLHPRISFGINPYYAKIVNSYQVGSATYYEEEQNMSTFGLNTYARGYVFVRPRFSAYMIASVGFGVMKEFTLSTDPQKDPYGPRIRTLPLASFFAGPGVSWKWTSNLAVELNVPLAVLYYIDYTDSGVPFSTALPTMGLQFFFGKKTDNR